MAVDPLKKQTEMNIQEFYRAIGQLSTLMGTFHDSCQRIARLSSDIKEVAEEIQSSMGTPKTIRTVVREIRTVPTAVPDPVSSAAQDPPKRRRRARHSQPVPAGSFAEWLWDVRANLKMTQPQIAEGIGVSSSVISYWENAAGDPSLRKLALVNKFAIDHGFPAWEP